MSIKSWLILLIISLSIPTICFSQVTSKDSTVIITPKQLKTTNLIFADHKRLQEENVVKDSIISNLTKINTEYEKIDSIQTKALTDSKEAISKLTTENQKSKKKLKRLRISTFSSLGLCIALIGTIFILR